jgi:hypothetical protein
MPRTQLRRTVNVPLYTPVSYAQVVADELAAENKLVKNLRNLLKSRPDLQHLAPFTRDGVRLFNYLFDSTRAAERVELPVKGFQMLPVEVTTSTKRGKNVIAVSEFIMGIVSEQLAAQKVAGKIERVATNRK